MTVTYSNPSFVQGGDVTNESSYLDRARYRLNDGNGNKSAPIVVREVRFWADQTPSFNPDGLPDTWVADNLNTSVSTGLRGPEDDPDGDGCSNIEEFMARTDPEDADSKPDVSAFDLNSLSYTGGQFNVSALESSTTSPSSGFSVQQYVRLGYGETSGEIDGLFDSGAQRKFFRIKRAD